MDVKTPFDSPFSGIRRCALPLLVAIAAVALALGVTTASAEAPAVTIDPATDVGYTTAKVSGTVDPKDVGTWWSFEISSDGGNSWSGFNFEGFAEENTGVQNVPTGGPHEFTGLTPGTEYQVRLVATNFSDPEAKSSVESFTTLPVAQPTVSLDPVSAITATSAHFEGQINPNAPEPAPVSDPKVEDAFKVTYRFECTPACPNTPEPQVLPAGDQSQTVSFDPSGLVPNRNYTVKLFASNVAGEVVSEQSFKTEFGAPLAETGAATDLEPTEAVIAAKVNPYGQATTYHFEYGTDTSYGSFAPAGPTAIGSGHATEAVTRRLAGLEPNIVYHYRIVATNATGTTAGEDRSFKTPIDRAERAYEQVSPVNKQGGMISYPNGFTGVSFVHGVNTVSPDGEAVLYQTMIPIGVGESAAQMISLRSERTENGWTTESVSPPPVIDPNGFNGGSYWALASEDLSVGLTYTDNGFDELDQDFTPPGGYGSNDLYTIRDAEPPRWESRPNGMVADDDFTPEPVDGDSYPVGFSRDGDAVLFSSRSAFMPGESLEAGWRLYLRRDGQTESVDVDDSGNSLSACGARVNKSGMQGGRPGFSPDLEEIAFVVPALGEGGPSCQVPSQVYVRSEDGTVQASASQRTPPDPAGTKRAELQIMSRDGSTVLFTTDEALTDDAPLADSGKLYSFDVNSGDLTYIDSDVRATRANNPIHAVTTDGSKVYYQRLNGNESGTLWVYTRGGGSEFITQLGDEYGMTQATPDGNVLVFTTAVNAAGEPDDSGSIYALFRYEDSTGDLACISCDVVDGPRENVVAGGDLSEQMYMPGKRLVSPDGKRIVFMTSTRLAVRDTNQAYDIYLWEEGDVEMISDGRARHSYLLDASADLDEIFFVTEAQLLPTDKDGAIDVYVSKVDGGFGSAADGEAPCEGAGCQTPGPSPPSEGAGGSAAFHGLGNAKGKPTRVCGPLATRAAKVAGKAKKAEGKERKRLRRKAARLKEELRRCRLHGASNPTKEAS